MAVIRNFSVSECSEVISIYDDNFYGIEDPHQWMYKAGNYVLNEGDNFTFFNQVQPHVYAGHIFLTARGHQAKILAEEMLSWMFIETDAEVIRGMPPLKLRHVRWMLRQLGFKSFGVIDTDRGPSEMFLLYKTDFEKRTKE